MMKRMLILCLAMELFATCTYSQQSPIDSLIKDFKGFIFDSKIKPAKLTLEI
jgi:hypothetical protein